MNRQDLARAIKATATYYNRQLDAEVLSMMCDDLDDLAPDACIAAYMQYRRNPANRAFPLPAQIRELVAPEEYVAVETQAREIASRIVGGIAKHGWCNGREAEADIGPIGWQLVQRYGGWSRLCQDVGTGRGMLNPLTLQAQLRDQLEGTIRYGAPAIAKAIGATPKQTNGLESIGSIMNLLPEKPEGA